MGRADELQDCEDCLAPADTFAIVGEESRLAILEALWRLDAPAAFSDLRAEVGTRDSAQFNYHLGKLTDQFVHKTDAGYELRTAGERIVQAILAGSFTQRPDVKSRSTRLVSAVARRCRPTTPRSNCRSSAPTAVTVTASIRSRRVACTTAATRRSWRRSTSEFVTSTVSQMTASVRSVTAGCRPRSNAARSAVSASRCGRPTAAYSVLTNAVRRSGSDCSTSRQS